MGDFSEVLFIGGRSGVGKSTVAHALHAKLVAVDVRHAVIEGDNLDLAWPPAWEHGLAEKNLAVVWENYRQLGYRRLIYSNTVSVRLMGQLAAAMGDDPRMMGVLLTADDETTYGRLAERESGESLDAHYQRSKISAAELERTAPSAVQRVATGGRGPADIADEILKIMGWAVTGR